MNSLSTIFMFVTIMAFAIGHIQMLPVEDCGPNEIAADCAPSQSCQPSCNQPNGTECPLVCDINTCVCKEGFVRDNNNNFQCIEPTQCSIPTTTLSSSCGPNEVGRQCALPLTCQPTCDNSNGTLCHLTCSANSCECKEGFIRHSQDDLTCIEQTQCSISTTAPSPSSSTTHPSRCGPNEVESQCALLQTCQPTCDNPNGSACPDVCSINPCQCKKGFIRLSQNDLTCIEQTQCSISITTPPSSCGPNEVESQCALFPSCQPTCDNRNGTLCPLICNLNLCECKEGFIRDSQHNLTCIEQTQCSITTTTPSSRCAANEVGNQCALLQTCQPTCNNPNGSVCPPICSPNPCQCKEGFIRHSEDDLTCIEQTQCSITTTTPSPSSSTTPLPSSSTTPSSRCAANEVENQCATLQTCQPTCDNPSGTVCPPTCSPNPCECKEGFIHRSQDDLTCIAQTQCNTSTTTPSPSPTTTSLSGEQNVET